MATGPQSIPNFRDVGEFINDAADWQRLRQGLLFRSARPDDASYQDRQRLVKDYKIRTIIDLRTKTEHIQQAQKRDARIRSSEAIPQSNAEAAEPLKIPGITYHDINFNGRSFSWMLLSHLSWKEFFRLILLMTFGYRTDAIKILSPTMNSMGLVGLAKSSLDVCKKEVEQVFSILAEETSYPVLVHCTQGKDRTGLIVMLVLLIMELGRLDVITKDYLESEDGLRPQKEEMLLEMEKVGFSPSFTQCPRELVVEVDQHLKDTYGGAAEYLVAAGLTVEQVENVRRILHRSTDELPVFSGSTETS